MSDIRLTLIRAKTLTCFGCRSDRQCEIHQQKPKEQHLVPSSHCAPYSVSSSSWRIQRVITLPQSQLITYSKICGVTAGRAAYIIAQNIVASRSCIIAHVWRRHKVADEKQKQNVYDPILQFALHALTAPTERSISCQCVVLIGLRDWKRKARHARGREVGKEVISITWMVIHCNLQQW